MGWIMVGFGGFVISGTHNTIQWIETKWKN
jgi:hypothetical protein